MFFLSVVFGVFFLKPPLQAETVRPLKAFFFAFPEPEIVAVRTTVGVIRAGAAGDLQFLRQSGINKDSFWLLLGFKFSFFSLVEPSTEDESVPALYPADFSPHLVSRSRFPACIPARRPLGVHEASAQCAEGGGGRQEVPACMVVPGGTPQDNAKKHRAGRGVQGSAGSWHQVSRQHPPGKLPAQVLLPFSQLTSRQQEEQVHTGARWARPSSHTVSFRRAAHSKVSNLAAWEHKVAATYILPATVLATLHSGSLVALLDWRCFKCQWNTTRKPDLVILAPDSKLCHWGPHWQCESVWIVTKKFPHVTPGTFLCLCSCSEPGSQARSRGFTICSLILNRRMFKILFQVDICWTALFESRSYNETSHYIKVCHALRPCLDGLPQNHGVL